MKIMKTITFLTLIVLFFLPSNLLADSFQDKQDTLKAQLDRLAMHDSLYSRCALLVNGALIRLEKDVWENPDATRNLLESIASIIDSNLPLTKSDILYTIQIMDNYESSLLAQIQLQGTKIVEFVIYYDSLYDSFPNRKKLREIEETKRNKINAKIQKRRKYANTLEFYYIDQEFMDTKFSTIGKHETTLQMEYILMARVLAHHTIKEWVSNGTFATLKSLGFTEIIFTDGRDFSSNYMIE